MSLAPLTIWRPESLEAEGSVDHRADLFSLGVMFYQMLTGALPKGAFQPPSKKVEIDIRLDDIVLKAMQSEPNLRYQNAKDIKNDVGAVSSTSMPKEQVTPTAAAPKPRKN